ncbi:tRNA threonylcarbamoyl adenosine modification protein YeaZ [Hamadaea flava]|uniref:tRNA (Adenosine(37)-N6)-threonylcarbamoyltransferase complex dimerization subunit type 1 TsaB n=1 Tax=Hamadaea flava TaxID=1742688 RepID=A0ABV8LG94_9ACTN|nr:tRNA (adenosine(37)-N6)-threonylcarbamoyltransferase complex dimerization subunit type 1 TsaB [Hamadaea flava]MCP2326529.1 tRNA threonylcarbamoyl adenosine modification protein YeaZ [Hamadaea flava]
MLVLVVDTATPAITAAVAEVTPTDVVIRAERVTVDGKKHGELLAPQIDAALAESGVKPRELTAIVAGVGPGPFTGLRVGLMTAASIGEALGIPTYAVCSLDGLGATTSGTALVATDARRREVYWAAYSDGERIDGPHVAKPADVAQTVADHAVGEGARKYADQLGLAVSPEAPDYPSAEWLARLAAARVRENAPSERLTPLYLRRPDAVEPGAPKRVS